MTRYGDYIVCLSATLNACALVAYLVQGHWVHVMYWAGALLINLSVLRMK